MVRHTVQLNTVVRPDCTVTRLYCTVVRPEQMLDFFCVVQKNCSSFHGALYHNIECLIHDTRLNSH